MSYKVPFFLLAFMLICISLLAEDPFLIRENTNFNYNNNSISLEDGVVSVWSDTKTSVWNLYVQKVDAAGNKLWNNGEPLLIYGTPNQYPGYHKAVKTSDNGVIILWAKFFGSNDYRMYAQKISNSGQILWPQSNELILESTYYPRSYLVANDVGGAYVYYCNEEGLTGLNLDANANDFWAAYTEPIFTDLSIIIDVICDNNGGVIINYEQYSGDENLMAARINFDREILWNEIVAVSLPYYYYPNIIAAGSSDFIIWWKWEDTVIGQRFDSSGNRYWGDEGLVINDEAVYENSHATLSGCEDGFFMTYIVEDIQPEEYIFKVQKFDLSANAIWANATILNDYYCYRNDMLVNSNQDCFIIWYNNTSLFAQKVDTDGNKLWGDEGVVFGTGINFEWTQGGLQINEINNEILLTWQPCNYRMSYLRYQSLDQAGNLLLPGNGVDIQSGMQSGIDSYQLIGNDDSSYSFWEDYRFGLGRIFVQRTSPNGDNYFPKFGIAITDTSFHHQENFRIKALPEGGVALVWCEVKENEELKRVRWQILNPDGTVLSPNGNDITVDVNADQTKPNIDVVDGDIVIAWLEDEKIKAQKLVNYSPVWGNDGSLLIENGDTAFFTIIGSYIKFDYWDENYFQRIDENGNLAADWPSPGVWVSSSYNSFGTMDEYNGDMVFSWYDNDAGIKKYGFQILTAAGEYIYPDIGFVIADDVNFNDHDYLFDGCINFFHEEETGTNIIMERYDLDGNVIWNEVTIQNSNNLHDLSSIKMGENFLVSWRATFDETTSSYIMRMIDSNGNLIQSNLVYDDFLIISERRDYQIVSTTDTDASILFKRGYDVGSETTFFFSGLVSYQVNVSDVPISEDEIVTTDNIQLSNYPNPFNPTTEISFQLSDFNENDSAEIEIYNLKGQKTKTISVILSGVEGSAIWDGIDDNEKQVSSGIYFYKLNVNGKTKASRKCLLLK
jgi:hypothetical protein